MRVAAAWVALVLAGCPKERVPSGAPPAVPSDAPPVVAVIDAPPPPVPYRAAAVAIVSDEIAPAALDWNHPTLTEDELEQALEDLDAVRRRGPIIVRLTYGRLDTYDAVKHQLPFVGNGLQGIQVDPPIAFTPSPTVTRGEMPLGGHARLDIDVFRGAIAVDAAGAKALVDADAKDPLVTDFLFELGDPMTVDGADVVRGTLRGVRIVREVAHETYLEGTPTRLGR